MKKNNKEVVPERFNDEWSKIVLTDDQIELLNIQSQFFDGCFWYIFLVPSVIRVDGENFYITDNKKNLNSTVKEWYNKILRAYADEL